MTAEAGREGNERAGAAARPHVRVEHDAMGEVEVPAGALWGAQTQRAASWSFSGRRLPLRVVHAMAGLKAAAARVHGAAGRLEEPMAAAIELAAIEVADGLHDEHFVVDLFQTGSGTSSHMNVNEVVANRAAELLGQPRGSRAVHPNDHVNLGMSSNDVVPSAVQLAAVELAETELLPAFERLAESLHELADRTWDDVRNGRTHLMPATPIRFGQQFRGAAQRIDGVRRRLAVAVDACRELPLGGTAVGTGINCPPEFPAAVCAELQRTCGFAVRETPTHLAAAGSLDPIGGLAADLRHAAIALYKITEDLRWQAAALREVVVPELQPGSSIMPGKVNPVVCEAVAMVCAQVVGNDAVVAFAGSQGNFELNTMLPVVAHNVLEAGSLLAGAATVLRRFVLQGLRPNPAAAAAVAANPMLATALAPRIGYDGAAAIAHEAAERQRPVLDVARERTDLDAAELAQLLDPTRLCGDRGRRRS